VAPMRRFQYVWKPPQATCWRGIYRWEDEEHEGWKEALQAFPYKVCVYVCMYVCMCVGRRWWLLGAFASIQSSNDRLIDRLIDRLEQGRQAAHANGWVDGWMNE
jgi:hypothetical protein